MNLYFRDNFFSSGTTEILNERNEPAGHLDLKSAFNSALDVYGPDGRLLCCGRFPFFSGKWEISRETGQVLGVLRSRFSFLTKKFTYETDGRGSYDILSPAFSKEYEVIDVSERRVAHFSQVSGWFASGAFQLNSHSEDLDPYELIAVIMGMHTIQKRQHSAAT